MFLIIFQLTFKNTMFKKIFILILFLILGINYTNASVTVIGNTDAFICYKNAKFGNSTNSAVNTCLNVLSDKTVSKKNSDATRINLGIIYNNKLEPRKALEQFQIAFKNKKMRAEILLNQGNSLLILKNYLGALEKYDESLKNNLNDSSAAYFNKGMAHEYLGNIEKAVNFYKKAVSLNPALIDFFDNKKRKLKEADLWETNNERENS